MTSHRPLSSDVRRLIGVRARASLLVLLVAGCALLTGQPFATDKGISAMASNSDCTDNPVARSRCIIEAILDDVDKTYTQTGGGGISHIDQDATWTYTVSINQEERTDLITYTVEMSDDGKVTITDRKTATKSR